MQVISPTPSPAPHNPSPSRAALGLGGTGSSEAKPSPTNASPRRLRRSLRLSGAGLSSPQHGLNKENLGASYVDQPSTSAKTLETLTVGASDNDKLSSPRLSSSRTSSPIRQSSPLRSRSSPIRIKSPLRRSRVPQSDDIASSSDESDDSTLVFFGKPSSAEKKKRMHYEQRVLEKRLKHKDSLDLARRRPISFNPDDTMLIDDQHAYGWSWNKPTPTPSRLGSVLLASSPDAQDSPTQSRGNTRNSSSQALLLQMSDTKQLSSPSHSTTCVLDELASNETPTDVAQNLAAQGSPQKIEEAEAPVEVTPETQPMQIEENAEPKVNPFVAASTSPVQEPTPKSPSKQRSESPRRAQSPVRLIETLIGATMAHNRDLASPMRSPRRSPRLSLRALQLSTSPTKPSGSGLFFGPSTPFQQSLASQPSVPFQHSTPFQQPPAALPIPPSTGLSRFACLQNLSSVNKAPETPSHRALSMRQAHPAVLPSPFISSGLFEPLAETSFGAPARLENPSPSPANAMRSPSAKHRTPSPRKQSASINEPCMDTDAGSRSASPSKPVPAPGTPSVRSVEPDVFTSPSKSDRIAAETLPAARSPSPSKAHTVLVDTPRSPERADAQTDLLSSPLRDEVAPLTELPSTPPQAPVEHKAETPGPVFRQTARRVPIQQHEADFGVKVSPEKPTYSPRKAYANSSARTNDFGSKPERIPARRVPVQSAPALRQVSSKQAEPAPATAARFSSVASKAARTVSAGASRIGGQSTSLAAAALTRTVSAAAPPAAPAPVSAPTHAQPASRAAAMAQGSSVASKASRLSRPASAAFGTKPSSPSKQPRSLSGLPRPRLASAAATTAPAAGPGSRLPRPATLGPSTTAARPTSRPIPMAIARLAPAQQNSHRTTPTTAAPKSLVGAPTREGPAEGAAVTEPSEQTQDVQMNEELAAPAQASDTNTDAEVTESPSAGTQMKQHEEAASHSVPLRRQISASALRVPTMKAETVPQPESTGQSLQAKTARTTSRTAETVPLRSSSPVVPAPPARPPSSARSAPPVVLDPEQQRLRCLAMQEKARNRAPKASSSASAATSSDAEELPSSEAGASGDSPQASNVEPASVPPPGPSSAPSAVEALATKHAEAMDAGSSSSALSSASNDAIGSGATAPSTTSTGRPLRSTRSATRPLTPSATRVPPSRGRALSLNDIIAARKIDVPLSLTDQLRLADTVNKKHNEKTLARYKITKVQRPYERPPSPERHDHEPEACTVIDDFGSHRQGKGDVAPYSTPVKSSSAALHGDGRKCVRWYRPLFVGKGAQYGLQTCETKPVLKPIQYELDRMGNKVATGSSPKLSKGQSIVIYRNYFQGEPEPADD